jgi:hypothetical protein
LKPGEDFIKANTKGGILKQLLPLFSSRPRRKALRVE